MPHRTLDMDEVTGYLHLSRADVMALVRRREIPHEKVGEQVRFRKVEIDSWASQRLLGFSAKNLHEFHQASTARMHDLSAGHALVPDLMTPSYIIEDMPARTKGSVIREMVTLAASTGLLLTPEDLQASVEEREALCSTALNGGFALLHAHVHEPWMFEDSFVALGRSIGFIPFGAPDGRTSNLFFLVCSQDEKIHLHMLARLSMLCHHTSVLLDLAEAESADGMYEALVAAEQEVLKA